MKTIIITIIHLSTLLLSPYIQAENKTTTNPNASNCLGCHGNNGNSSIPTTPSLAGQSASYIYNQLQAFKSGKRTNPIMQDIASNLEKQNIKELSRYFSTLKPKPSASGNSALVKAGQEKIAMCQGCHGSSLQGRGNFPRLAGQQPEYIKKQLFDFKNRSRKGGAMNSISSSLSKQDIDEIAAYLSNL